MAKTPRLVLRKFAREQDGNGGKKLAKGFAVGKVAQALKDLIVMGDTARACHWCGRAGLGTTVDHVMPRILGGSNARSNLVRSCYDCNQLKGGMHPKEWAIVMRDIPEWWRLAKMKGPRGTELVKAMRECGFDFNPASNGQPYEVWWER